MGASQRSIRTYCVKLAMFMIALFVIELLMETQQAQSLKMIKKGILLKKFKKRLLLSLKNRPIIIPIPIPYNLGSKGLFSPNSYAYENEYRYKGHPMSIQNTMSNAGYYGDANSMMPGPTITYDTNHVGQSQHRHALSIMQPMAMTMTLLPPHSMTHTLTVPAQAYATPVVYASKRPQSSFTPQKIEQTTELTSKTSGFGESKSGLNFELQIGSSGSKAPHTTYTSHMYQEQSKENANQEQQDTSGELYYTSPYQTPKLPVSVKSSSNIKMMQYTSPIDRFRMKRPSTPTYAI